MKGRAATDDKTFNRPTDIVFSPDGKFVYVSDGYGNSRVVKFTYDGQYVTAWANPAPRRASSIPSTGWPSTPRAPVFVSDRENNRIQIFDANGRFPQTWTHLGATQNIFITARDHVVITHRNNIENLTYDTLAGRITKIDKDTGRILGAMESPGHWIHATPENLIFIGSLTGNCFRWYPAWLDKGLGADEGLRPAR